MGEGDHDVRDGGVVGIAGDLRGQGAVDLQRVDREALQVAEGGAPGAEIVDRDPHSQRLQRPQRGDVRFRPLHGARLGDLELEEAGLELRLLQRALHLAREVGVLELAGREIDRHPQPGMSRILPRARLGAGRAQDPGAERDDEPGHLGERDEVRGRNQTQLGMAPAQQRLHRSHAAGGDVEHGLVVEDELVLPDGMAEAALQGQALEGGGVERGRAELIVVATLLLRPVHAGVGVLDERIRVAPVLRVEADADAGGGQELPVLDEEGRPQRVEDLLRDPRRVHHLGHAGEQQRELVPAQARYGVAFAQAGAQALRHVLDEPVAGGVAEGVVDGLEAVEVQEEHGQVL